MFIADILKEITKSLRSKGDILSIVDNADNTYTFSVSKITKLLIDEMKIKITSDGFNEYAEIVFDIDYTLKTFKIKKQSGVTIPVILGTYESLAPFYYFSEPVEYSGYLANNENETPAIFLRTKFDEEDESGNKCKYFSVNPLNISFLKRTELVSNTEERHKVNIPYLFELFKQFSIKLSEHPKITYFGKSKHRKVYFAEMQTNEVIDLINANYEIEYTVIDCK